MMTTRKKPFPDMKSVALFTLVGMLSFHCFIGSVEAQSGNKVLLRDLTSITLRRGEYTTGRRSSPVPQLQCTGGTAYGAFSPKAVQCVNRGFDGVDVQWECKAEMGSDFEFGKIEVSCEGFDYPNDPFVLVGSCGLNYELDYSSTGARTAPQKPSAPYYDGKGSGIDYMKIAYFAAACFVIYLIYTSLSSPREGNEGDRRRGGGGGGPGPGHPPGPGWRPQHQPPPPPSYDESCNKGSTAGGCPGSGPTNASTSSGPGFFTGMGLGALGGYMFGNRNTGRNNYGYNQFEQDTGFHDSYDRPSTSTGYFGGGGGRRSGGGGGSSSSTHTSTGFGGTTRR